MSLRTFICDVGRKLSRSSKECEPFIDKLAENWFDTVESLQDASDEDLVKIGVPMRFAKEIVLSLGSSRPRPRSRYEERDTSFRGKGSDRDGSVRRSDDLKGGSRKGETRKGDRGLSNGLSDRGSSKGDRGFPDKGPSRKGEGKFSAFPRKGDSDKGSRKGESEKGSRKGDFDKSSRKGDKGEKGKGKGTSKDKDSSRPILERKSIAKGSGRERREAKSYAHAATVYLEIDAFDKPFPWHKKISGDGNANLNHIQGETKTLATVKGEGSKCPNPEDREGPLRVEIHGDEKDSVELAEDLMKDLFDSVVAEYYEAVDKADGSAEDSEDKVDADDDDETPIPERSEEGERPRKGKGKGKSKSSTKGKSSKGKMMMRTFAERSSTTKGKGKEGRSSEKGKTEKGKGKGKDKGKDRGKDAGKDKGKGNGKGKGKDRGKDAEGGKSRRPKGGDASAKRPRVD